MTGIENCWEFKHCGREPGGPMADESGICPVITAAYADGMNRGINGGRICWVIMGRCVRDEGRCIDCDLFNLLEQEEVESNFH
jgi:hypothetical protein